jgi:uncharacterized membrane protein
VAVIIIIRVKILRFITNYVRINLNLKIKMQPQNQIIEPNNQPAKSSFTEYHPKKATKIILAILNVMGLIPILLWAYLSNLASQGVSGTEYFGILIAPLFILTLAAIITNLIFAIRFIRRNHQHSKAKIFAWVVLVTSVLILGFIIVTNVIEYRKYHKENKNLTLQESMELVNNCKVERIVRNDDRTSMMLSTEEKKFGLVAYTAASNFPDLRQAAKNASVKCNLDIVTNDNNYVRSYITETEAINLLNTCQINAFYYNDNRHNLLDEPIQPGTDTGIQLRKDYEYNEMYITENKLEQKFVTIAHQAQKSCPKLAAFNNEDPLEDPNYYQ